MLAGLVAMAALAWDMNHSMSPGSMQMGMGMAMSEVRTCQATFTILSTWSTMTFRRQTGSWEDKTGGTCCPDHPGPGEPGTGG